MNFDWIESTKYSAEQLAASYDNAFIIERCKNLNHRYLCSFSGVFDSAAEDRGRETPQGIAYRVCSIACDLSTQNTKEQVSEEYLRILSCILVRVSAPELRVHFYDVLWAYGRKYFPNSIEFARKFLKEMLKIDLSEGSWFGDQYCNFWRRAVEVSVCLGRGVEQESSRIYATLKAEYASAVSADDRLLAWAIPHLFFDYKVYDVISPRTFAENYEKMADRALNIGENYYAQTHYNDAKEWYGIAKLPHDCNRMIVGYANSCVREAENESNKEQVSWARVGTFYDMAISAYMSIPKSERDAFDVEAKLDTCKKLSDAAYSRSLPQMKTMQGPVIDISDIVKEAKECVRGKEFIDAIKILCVSYSFSESQAEQQAKQTLNGTITPFLMGKIVLGGGTNARPVASAPAMPIDTENKEGQSRLDFEKISAAAFLAKCSVCSQLYPAYEVIKSEHKDTMSKFKSLVDDAPLIPVRHKRVYAEALELGFEGRYTLASYILAPEIENIVREALNKDGVVTTSLQGGFQQEKGLSSLVNESQLVHIFDPDFVFELKAIFCEHAGPNVRNVVAHGLKDDSWFNTFCDFYVWWFALRIVFMRRTTIDE